MPAAHHDGTTCYGQVEIVDAAVGCPDRHKEQRLLFCPFIHEQTG